MPPMQFSPVPIEVLQTACHQGCFDLISGKKLNKIKVLILSWHQLFWKTSVWSIEIFPAPSSLLSFNYFVRPIFICRGGRIIFGGLTGVLCSILFCPEATGLQPMLFNGMRPFNIAVVFTNETIVLGKLSGKHLYLHCEQFWK